MKANRNGSSSVSQGWEDDRSPLLHLSEQDVLTVRQSYEHTLILGGTGSGKSSGPGRCLASAMLMHPARYSFCVTTTKPGDAEDWVRLAKSAGRESDLLVFSPEQPHRFALLDHAFRGAGGRGSCDPDNVISLLTTLLEIKNGKRETGGDQQFWSEMANKLHGHCIDLLASSAEPITFRGLNAILSSLPTSPEEVASKEFQERSYMNQLLDKAIARKDLSRIQQNDLKLALEYFLSTVPRMDDRLRSGIFASSDSITHPFLRGQLAELCDGQSNLSPEQTFKGRIVVLDLPIKQYHQTGRFIQLLFAMLWCRAAESRNLQRYPNPLCLFMDEAQNFIHRHFPLFLATARSARIATVLLTQNLGSLHAALGKADTEALIGNCNNKFICASDHVETNEWFSKLVGQYWGFAENNNASLMGQGGISAGTSEQLMNHIQPAEFAQLRKGGPEKLVEAIMFRSGLPFVASGLNYLRVLFPQNIA